MSALDDSDTKEALAQFKRGVQAAGQLTHPNIVNIYDYGETKDCAYIVMEFVDGLTLKQMLDSGERFDIRSICKTMGGILEGLQYSHGYGVVHRDMKPANIMFTKDKRVKIAETGIARLEDNNMTQTGMVIGTPAYMSPEQFMGEKIDWRSDVYSTAVVLYHMIRGVRPYDGNIATIMNRVLSSPVPRPSGVSPMATPALDQVVMRAMAKKREQRFQSAAEFNAALQAILTRPDPAPRHIETPRVEVAMPPRPLPRRALRPSPVLVAALVMILAAAGSALTFYWRSTSGSSRIRLASTEPGKPSVPRADHPSSAKNLVLTVIGNADMNPRQRFTRSGALWNIAADRGSKFLPGFNRSCRHSGRDSNPRPISAPPSPPPPAETPWPLPPCSPRHTHRAHAASARTAA